MPDVIPDGVTAFQCSACGYTYKHDALEDGRANVRKHIGQKRNMDDLHDENTEAMPLVIKDE